MHANAMRVRKRLATIHLRHSWVTAGQPGEPMHLQCKECCKLKVYRDPERFDRQVQAAAGRCQSFPYP